MWTRTALGSLSSCDGQNGTVTHFFSLKSLVWSLEWTDVGSSDSP